jgi:hypothetical protein
MEQVFFRVHIRIVSSFCALAGPRVSIQRRKSEIVDYYQLEDLFDVIFDPELCVVFPLLLQLRTNLERTLLALSLMSLTMFALMHHSFTGAYIDQSCFQSALYGVNGANPQRFTDSDIIHIYLMDNFSSFNTSHYTSNTTVLPASHHHHHHHHHHHRPHQTKETLGEEELSTTPAYTFSAHRGFLMLPPLSREKYNISNAVFYLPSDSAEKCFHLPWKETLHNLVPFRFLIYTFGYDTIILNLMRKLSYDEGFLYMEHRRKFIDLSFYSRFVFSVATMNSFGNPLLWDNAEVVTDGDEKLMNMNMNASQIWENNCVATDVSSVLGADTKAVEGDGEHSSVCTPQQQHIHFLTTWRDKIFFKLSIIITATFLFFAMTSMVSFILKQTQSRMLKFTFLLQYHVRNHIPYLSLVFIHVFESLIFVPIMLGKYCLSVPSHV